MSDSVEDTLYIAGECVPYTLRRTLRRTLGISVDPDGSIEVRAPRDAPLETVRERLRRRRGWIAEQRRQFEALRPRTPSRQYAQGETHRYLGRQLRLRHVPAEKPGVRIEGDRLVIAGVRSEDGERTAVRLTAWYRDQARRVFAQRLNLVLNRFVVDGVMRPTLSIRKLEKRWGSLSRDGRVMTLNVRLIEAAPELIDYVVTHELTHALHPDHGPAFVSMLERKMPDWAKRKALLERSML